MNFLKILKYTQPELIRLLNRKDIDLKKKGYNDLQESINHGYVFNKERFLECAEILDIPKDEIFKAEEVSKISFRGSGAEESIKSTLKLFSIMVEQRKLRGNVNVQ
ncbi:hypothetical protein MUA34_01220 [Staphylococcus delphini]|uniref:hypothetical protein n=1 Tax=Staphylococcus delphini TaxID=53344 RepID=UPI0021D30455|nr:hypothetical protein [Staphylococcus delphini]UXS37102.1 hypothetical protein MUA34_01220 [Staphylococcus delphini]